MEDSTAMNQHWTSNEKCVTSAIISCGTNGISSSYLITCAEKNDCFQGLFTMIKIPLISLRNNFILFVFLFSVKITLKAKGINRVSFPPLSFWVWTSLNLPQTILIVSLPQHEQNVYIVHWCDKTAWASNIIKTNQREKMEQRKMILWADESFDNLIYTNISQIIWVRHIPST